MVGKVRLNRLLNQGKCLDVAIDHGIANEPDFLIGLEDIAEVMKNLIIARPDAIQVNMVRPICCSSIRGINRR